jgi:carbon monoxide dehydrogenase subunit G
LGRNVEFEKVTTVPGRAERVWRMLLDPQVMKACVPGMQTIDVLSEREYLVSIQIKVSFITARFKVRTTVVDMREPEYLRSDGAGEDATLTSSLQVASEVFLKQLADDTVELRMRLKVQLFGRFGDFGMNIVKTKADRMWEEFGRNLADLARTESATPR